jgi:hypothetical protein
VQTEKLFLLSAFAVVSQLWTIRTPPPERLRHEQRIAPRNEEWLAGHVTRVTINTTPSRSTAATEDSADRGADRLVVWRG